MEFVVLWAKLLALHIIVFALPNTQEVMRRFDPALGFKPLDSHVRWSASLDGRWALGFGVLAAFGLMAMTQHSAFLYYQF
jgi:alginate O-acetyltransferase complex protein AlgI